MTKQKNKNQLIQTKNPSKLPYSLLLALCLLLVLPALALAQEPSYDEINEVAKNMNCPTCVGINLADCRTQTCEQWRSQIADLLAEGYTEQEVFDYFEARYGTQVLLEPPRSGSTLILWVLPVVAVMAGSVWLGLMMRKWNQAKLATTPTSTRSESPVSDDYLKQVEKDLDL